MQKSQQNLTLPYPFKRKLPPRAVVVGGGEDIYHESQKPFNEKESRKLRQHIFQRILNNESLIHHPKQRQNLFKTLIFIVTRLYCDITPDLEEKLLKFILENPKTRGNLILLWLTELYDQSKGFSCCVKDSEEACIFFEAENNARYDTVMVNALARLFEQNLHNDTLFHRIFLEAPIITPNALHIIRKACADPETSAFSMVILRELILTRNRQRYDFIKVLLELSYVDENVVRQEAIQTAKELSNLDYVYPEIREFIVLMCQRITEPIVPPAIIWSSSKGVIKINETESVPWNESYAKAALILPLTIGSIDKSLLPEITKSCKKAPNCIKRYLLAFIEEFTTKV